MLRRLTMAAVLAAAFAAPAMAQEPIRIGAFLSATGPNSFLGEPESKTLRLYVQRINAAGGVLGRPLRLFEYDDGGDTPRARTLALRLATEDRVAVMLGGTVTGTTMAALPVAEQEEVPFISLAGAIVIVEPVRRWVFKIPATDRIAAARVFEHMRRAGITRVGMLNGSDGYGQSGREQATRVAREIGIAIVGDETYAPTDADMTAQLTRLRNAPGIQAVLNFGIGAGPSIIARGMRQLGATMPLYLSPAIASRQFLEITGAAAEGVRVPVASLLIASQLPADHPQRAAALEYGRTYREAYNEDASYGGATAYDGLMIALDAIRRAGSTDRARIRDAIEATRSYAGINGVVNMTAQDHMGLVPEAFFIAVVRNNDWVLD